MFKQYGPNHIGIFIPVGRRRRMIVWNAANDAMMEGHFRRHICITVRIDRIPAHQRLYEFRIRFGALYL